MRWVKEHGLALAGLVLSCLFLYLQLQQWKRHGDDFVPLAVSIVVTLALWALLVFATARYLRLAKGFQHRSRPDILRIESAGTLKNLAGQADWLASDLERIWYEFDKEQKKLVYPLGKRVIPDEIKEHTDKLLLSFRVQYQSHIGFVKSVDPEFHSGLIDEGFPCDGQDYLAVKRKIEAHAEHLRKRANEVMTRAFSTV
jgi:hypothetical protein